MRDPNCISLAKGGPKRSIFLTSDQQAQRQGQLSVYQVIKHTRVRLAAAVTVKWRTKGYSDQDASSIETEGVAAAFLAAPGSLPCFRSPASAPKF